MTERSMQQCVWSALARAGVARDARLLVAVSGGADSMALLDMLLARAPNAGAALTVGHVAHGIRAEAERDAALVRDVCRARGVPFLLRRVDAPAHARKTGTGLEDAARQLRYDALDAMRLQAGASAIVLAHHMDDQAETVLLHLLSGSVDGLSGMQSVQRDARGLLLRPMLHLRRADIEAYCAGRGLAFVTDDTNQDVRYARNRVRGELLPLLARDYNPAIVQTLSRNAALAAQDRAYLAQQAEAACAAHMRACADGVFVAEAAGQLHSALSGRVYYRALCACGVRPEAQSVARLQQLMQAQVGRRADLGGGCVALRERGGLRMGRFAAPSDAVVAIAPGARQVETPWGTLDIACGAAPDDVRTPPCVQLVPEGALAGACVRRWKPGERIAPLGMTGTKCVSDVLCDARVPSALRAHVPVLAQGEKILWVMGYTAARAAAVRPGARCFQLTWQPQAR
nr:tRNA lysidine(34) synthetase TilS [Maliibacterium massiliense]